MLLWARASCVTKDSGERLRQEIMRLDVGFSGVYAWGIKHCPYVGTWLMYVVR